MKNTPDPLPSVRLLPVSGSGTFRSLSKPAAIFWQVISALSFPSLSHRANTDYSSSFIDGVSARQTPRHYPLSRVNCILIAVFYMLKKTVSWVTQSLPGMTQYIVWCDLFQGLVVDPIRRFSERRYS